MPYLFTRRELVTAAAACGAAIATGGQVSIRAEAAARNSDPIPGLDDYCRQALSDWQVPGVAVAVVRDAKLLLARGYGVCQLGNPAPVDANSVFSIGSCTKSFTAAMVGKLMDQEKMSWDDPLSTYLPTLEALSKENAPKPTIRHALQHRTGFPTANMLWRSGAFSGDEILRRACLLTPIAAPGKAFLYNNVMYLAAGNAAEKASGTLWSDFIRTEFFRPLGMYRSVCHSTELKELENVALPHATSDGKVSVIERYCPETIAPAGTIHSTASDMAQWLIMHLEHGRFDGRELLSPNRIDDMHAPVEPPHTEPAKKGVPKAPISRYGLGWFVNSHAERTVVEHTGSSTGFLAWMAMMPQERLGVVVLSNHHQTGINSALRSWIFDRLLSQPEKDWSTAVRTDYSQGWQKLLREAKAQFAANRLPERPTTLPLSEYAGRYESDLYGAIQVHEKDGRLRLQFETRFQGELRAWEADSFRAFFPNPRLDDWLVTFAIAGDKVASLRAQESPWAPEWYDDRDDLGLFKKR